MAAKKARPGTRTPRRRATRRPPTTAGPRIPPVTTSPSVGSLEPTGTLEGDAICYPLKYPPRYDERSLGLELALRLAGRPADGSSSPSRTGAAPPRVVWVDAGDEVLVHLDSLRVALRAGIVAVSIDLESDQTGRTPLVCTFALGDSSDPAGLFAATDELPRGNGLLAARWGTAVQAAAWDSLLGLVKDHAGERNLAPLGLAALDGALVLRAGEALSVAPLTAGVKK